MGAELASALPSAEGKGLQTPASTGSDGDELNYTLFFLPSSCQAPLAIRQTPKGRAASQRMGRCNGVFLKNKVSFSSITGISAQH